MINEGDDRKKATAALSELRRQANATKEVIPSWIGNTPANGEDNDDDPDVRFFNYTGFLYLPAFCSSHECAAMKQEMIRLVEEDWNPEKDGLDSFGTNSKQNQARGDYFLESATRVHFFTEPDAVVVDEKDGQKRLKEEFRNTKVLALNKVGHALHLSQGGNIFHQYTMSSKIRSLVLKLGWKDPVVPQSMYIFKQARTGGPVTSHQDSTFLFTTPKQSCLGLWLALDDANLDNGCLWVRPKSHNEPVRRQYKRNIAHFGEKSMKARSNTAEGDLRAPKFVMTDLDANEIAWEGELPDGGSRDGIWKAGFVPVECKAGDLLVLTGTLDHLSLANTSDKERHSFQLHLVEGPREGVVWSSSNWLQYPDSQPFLSLLNENKR